MSTKKDSNKMLVKTGIDSVNCELEDIKKCLLGLERKVQEKSIIYPHEVVGLNRRVNALEALVKMMRAA